MSSLFKNKIIGFQVINNVVFQLLLPNNLSILFPVERLPVYEEIAHEILKRLSSDEVETLDSAINELLNSYTETD